MSGDVYFAVRDVEDEPLDFDVDSVDLVLGSFGMGSFVDDLTTFLIGIKEQLKPGGQLILSFYNSEALLYRTPPPWRDSSLSATLVPDHDELEVSLPTGDRFRIFCRAYEYHKLKSQLSRIFDVVQITTCPAFSSFLPADYFSRGPGGKLARKIMAEVDRDLARRESLPIGAYFTAVCAKQPVEGEWSRPLRDIVAYRGQEELIRFLQEKRADYSIFVHERVRNVSDVQRRTGVELERMAKAILIVVDGPNMESDVEHVVVVLQGSLQIDVDKLSAVLGKQPRQWRFATQKEVKLAYGLEIGGVPPFGYSEGVRVVMDHRLARVDEVICGIGNPTHSVRLGGHALADICNARLEDIAEVVDYGN
jgi:prolyl-tRNA editing enzyme YbaK/EbsC (Cys-tRNA(Pro) deacylase)